MDNKDFLTVQNEVIEKVFELENIKRREYLAQFKYISLFHDYIIEQATLQYENRIMLEAIKSKADNVEFNVVEKKKELEDKINGFEANNNLGKQVLEVYDKYSLEDINSLDELYKEFISKYHPAINVKSSNEQVQLYQALTSVYLIGEVNEFKSMYETAIVNLKELVIEDDEDKIIETYKLTLENIKPLINKRKESLPFIYEDLVNDESKITSEISKFRESIYQLKEMNKKLRMDYEVNFNESF